eukprot:9013625-Pyramimonas_sp.AAC.1
MCIRDRIKIADAQAERIAAWQRRVKRTRGLATELGRTRQMIYFGDAAGNRTSWQLTRSGGSTRPC